MSVEVPVSMPVFQSPDKRKGEGACKPLLLKMARYTHYLCLYSTGQAEYMWCKSGWPGLIVVLGGHGLR